MIHFETPKKNMTDTKLSIDTQLCQQQDQPNSPNSAAMDVLLELERCTRRTVKELRKVAGRNHTGPMPNLPALFRANLRLLCRVFTVLTLEHNSQRRGEAVSLDFVFDHIDSHGTTTIYGLAPKDTR